jgi:hypothetical protein
MPPCREALTGLHVFFLAELGDGAVGGRLSTGAAAAGGTLASIAGGGGVRWIEGGTHVSTATGGGGVVAGWVEGGTLVSGWVTAELRRGPAPETHRGRGGGRAIGRLRRYLKGQPAEIAITEGTRMSIRRERSGQSKPHSLSSPPQPFLCHLYMAISTGARANRSVGTHGGAQLVVSWSPSIHIRPLGASPHMTSAARLKRGHDPFLNPPAAKKTLPVPYPIIATRSGNRSPFS